MVITIIKQKIRNGGLKYSVVIDHYNVHVHQSSQLKCKSRQNKLHTPIVFRGGFFFPPEGPYHNEMLICNQFSKYIDRHNQDTNTSFLVVNFYFYEFARLLINYRYDALQFSLIRFYSYSTFNNGHCLKEALQTYINYRYRFKT